jgi:hypothetical protein
MKDNLILAATTGLPVLSTANVDRLLVWHDNNKTLLENKGSVILYNPWLHTKIRDIDPMSNPVEISNTTPGAPWNGDFVKEFPELVEYFNCLPIKNITRIVLLETFKDCVPHIDMSGIGINFLEPSSYRMTLRDQQEKGFYVQPIPKEEFGSGIRKEEFSPYNKIYYHPEIGKWWILNNWSCQHGSDWTDSAHKVLISVQGVPSMEHFNVKKLLENIVYHPEDQNASN